jgi:hypothetical protein
MAGQPPERLPELPWVFTEAFPSDEAGVGMRFHDSYWWKTQTLRTVAGDIGTVDMSLFAILLFVGTVLSLGVTMRVRQMYDGFSLLPAP